VRYYTIARLGLVAPVWLTHPAWSNSSFGKTHWVPNGPRLRVPRGKPAQPRRAFWGKDAPKTNGTAHGPDGCCGLASWSSHVRRPLCRWPFASRVLAHTTTILLWTLSNVHSVKFGFANRTVSRMSHNSSNKNTDCFTDI
jgi:hypothetical protein